MILLRLVLGSSVGAGTMPLATAYDVKELHRLLADLAGGAPPTEAWR
jgi:hypothetical protein